MRSWMSASMAAQPNQLSPSPTRPSSVWMRTQIRVGRERSRIVSILVIFKTQSPCCTHGSIVIGVLPLLIFFGLSDKISDALAHRGGEEDPDEQSPYGEQELCHFADPVRITASGSWSGLSSPKQYRFLGPILLAPRGKTA